MKLWIVLFTLAVFAPAAPAQIPAPASIRGILVKWGTTEPVGQATIELRNTSGGDGPAAITASQDNGSFVFSNIPGGTYRIVAMADGFAPAEFGQLRPNGIGRPMVLAAGERANVQIGIVPGGVLSGKVTDQNGRPMVYSYVEILKAAYDATGQIVPVIALSVTANDLGEYRAFWLPPGPYIVRAGTSQLNSFISQGTTNPLGSDTTFPTTMVSSNTRPRARPAPAEGASAESVDNPVLSNYFGGVPEARNAQVVDIRPGEETSGIDIRVAPVQFSKPIRISGVVVDPSGQTNQNFFGLSISTWPEAQPAVFASIHSLTTRVPSTNPNTAPGAMRYVTDNGKFEGTATSGVYQIRASQGPLSGRIVIEARNQDLNVTVPLHQPTAVTGRLKIEGAGANSSFDLTTLQVGIRTPPAVFFSGPVTSDGQFRIEKVIDGDYQVSVHPFIPAPGVVAPVQAGMENTYVKSIQMGNTDFTSRAIRIEGTEAVGGIEIVLSLSGASVNGRVINMRKETVARATVILLPQGQPPYPADRSKSLTTDTSGGFQFQGLPPGAYRLFAWEDVDSGAWFNPAFLAAFESNAVPIQLIEGQRQNNLEIPVIPVSR